MAKFGSPATHIEDTVPQVPSALTIVAIDTNLTVLEFIKNTCNHDGIQVLACSESQSAVNALRKRKQRIDLILVEVDMPIMNGYEFLEFIKKEQVDVPLIMMSSDNSRASVMRAMEHGAYDYWVKPLQEFNFTIMRARVFQKKCMIADKLQKDSGCLKDDDKRRGRSDNSELASCMVHRSNSNFEEADVVDESCNPSPTKKPRVVWDQKLNASFVSAVLIIGIEKATPKKVLEVMNDPRLERTHIASHLQKYRKYLKQQQQKQEQQQQQNDMSLVSGRQIERQQSKQKDMSLPRTSALQPCSATATTNFHPGFTGNMEEEALAHGHPLAAFPNVVIPENFSEEQSNINRLLSNNFNAEQVLAHDHPSAIFPNIASNLISQPGTLDDASIYGLLTPSDTPLFVNPTILQIDTMQQPMNHNQMYPMNFQPSFTMISGNPAFASQNYNFGMNMGHGSQSIQDGNSIGEGILDQYSTIDSIYHPEFQNAGLPSGAVRRFAASDYRSQNPYIDGNLYQQ
ncbi:Two-component response regulator [Vigna angularis]|uniref:Two-component response regulator n=1 Tax=Phaseolus angularis TaxID=3914 RepID=A0A8T0KJS6_PHAAN|nr:two-component response regulator ARR14 [Vigna angularis]KAG2398235.1 Two-component response regulator [Vigna angularis]